MYLRAVPVVLPIQDFLAQDAPIFDVRSPGEFARGHIPGAINLPLFTDAERAVVGTLYKQEGRNAATLEGLRIVGPKMAGLVEQAWLRAPDGHARVHCWRGGERSASVAWLLEKAGFRRTSTLARGYKAFREKVLSDLAVPHALIILGGFTGTGKTELLGMLRELGEPVVDLEHIARHKGSSFGGIGEGEQPSTEHFENLLWHTLNTIGMEQPVWMEDESQMIGRAKIPDAFFAQMRKATTCFVDMPREKRAAHLVRIYGNFPKEQLADATHRIQKRLGPQDTTEALQALAANDLFRVAMITLKYYDKTYAHGQAKRPPGSLILIPADHLPMAELAQRLKHERALLAGPVDRV